MIIFQEETYNSLVSHKDFGELVKANWKETEVLNTSYQLSPKLEMYKTLANLNILKIYSVKDQESLVGYFIAIVTPHPHYANVTAAETDTFFIQKKYRKGLTGYKFLQYAINELKKRVDLIFLTTNTKRNLSNLLDRLGFKLADYKFVLEV